MSIGASRCTSVVAGCVVIASLLLPIGRAFALTLSDTSPYIGQPILVLDVNPNNFYAAFSINIDGPQADPCEYVAGADLVDDNDLVNYGTCFLTHSGTFQVVELSCDFVANYNDSIRSPCYVAKRQVGVKNNYLFTFSLSIPEIRDIISSVWWQENPRRSASTTLETYVSKWW